MRYSINPEDIKLKIEHRKRICLGSTVAFAYIVSATHMPTGVCFINRNAQTSVNKAIKQTIEGLEELVYLYKLENNKYNKNNFREDI